MGDSGSKMRQIYLVLCCTCYVVMQTFWLLMHHVFMSCMFVAIVGCVLVAEVVNVWKKGHTVSTETTIAIREGGKQRVYAYLAVTFMCLAIFFLALHFGWL